MAGSLLRTTALVVASVLTCLGSILAGAYYLSPRFYEVRPPTPRYSTPGSEKEAQRDDLNYLRQVTTLDWSYTDATRAAANAIIDRALRGPLPLGRGAFHLVVARVLATADNGHTNVWGAASANQLNRLPVRVYAFADGVFVVRALPEASQLLGTQIVAIDGMPIESVRAQLRPFTGGTESEKNARLPFYIESPELLAAAGVAKAADRATLTVRNAAGRETVAMLRARSPDVSAPALWPSAGLKPVPNAGENPEWLPALRGKADSLAMFADAPRAFFAGTVPAMRQTFYYVRFDTNGDDHGMSIERFCEHAMAEILRERPSGIVVDLRMDGGGDYTTTAWFMRGLPAKMPAATIYVLLSQETFSAGMTDAAFLKYEGGDHVVFVGDEPGDRIRFHSEGGDVCLPFSHTCMTVRTAIHDYSTLWCRPLLECYPLDRFYPAAISSFAPQIRAPLAYAALANGADPALDAIMAGSHDTVAR